MVLQPKTKCVNSFMFSFKQHPHTSSELCYVIRPVQLNFYHYQTKLRYQAKLGLSTEDVNSSAVCKFFATQTFHTNTQFPYWRIRAKEVVNKMKNEAWRCHSMIVLYLWHDQGEWVGCWEYWFWVTGLKRWQILMFYIVLNFTELLMSLQPDVRLRWVWIKM